MAQLNIKLNYNPIIFQEAELLSKCVMSCELLSRMAEEAFVIDSLHLANLYAGNVILVHCDQIKKTGWESRSNREKL